MFEAQNLSGETAIGRIPVVSANGKTLMPCKHMKARNLLEQGKAVKRQRQRQIKFNPSSPIVHPGQKATIPRCALTRGANAKSEDAELNDSCCGIRQQSSDDYRVCDMFPSDRESLARLVSSVLKDGFAKRRLSWRERLYVEALLKARWKRIRSSLVLKMLVPITKKMLKALGKNYVEFQLEYKGPMDKEEVKGLLSIMCRLSYKMMRSVAEEISLLAQRWGNKFSYNWHRDFGFIRYLMMMTLPQNKNAYASFTIKA